MKRLGNLYQKICSIENIELADKNARRGKHNIGIEKHDLYRESDNQKLLDSLLNHSYKTSEYTTFKIYEPKERLIFRLPYYPDRIVHWAIMNVLEPVWTKLFIKNTYSCIKGRGISKCAKDIRKALSSDKEGTEYCLKLDIRKFYPSIDHEILKLIIRLNIKDKELLSLLDDIIDSTDGVPIGNYLSLFFANLYLTPFDHWLKETCKVKYYFRYADDIVILSSDKEFLHNLLKLILEYLETLLRLSLKPNYLIFPVESRSIDFVGYKFYHTHTLLRSTIKHKMFKLLKSKPKNLDRRFTSYLGWIKSSNSKHLYKKYVSSRY